ncbi:NDMA-dependent alcohol dehydrogenase [Aeromicrobium ginsengisoli]|uniref:NDMA-dependent alcohol dehydrogenase n=1 Tax=Aeromicrobium ginsengisoli TaxID=363867 RepID=A0A5M4F958_9ACTN|nr:NDMA-dependent alcohol dehydrogenase [Aeromicrobium ginsengisoli]KAA1394305.1 NDMA-dependent alcohol dehydrogenase [Aeromicrobium ginsengisoli]
MKTRGAVVVAPGRPYEVVDLVLDEPRAREVVVKMSASGICHSDDHLATGDLQVQTYPFCGGHEGSGVVVALGTDVTEVEVDDHVVFSFVPACGRCRWCAAGQQNLCDLGAHALSGCRPDDPSTWRVHTPDGRPVGQMSSIGTFSEHTVVNVASVIKVDRDLPLHVICLLGCCVSTGWGSSVNDARVEPGDTIIVMGLGGIGMNAVQGARHAGAGCVIGVDPVAMKRTLASDFGATHAVASMQEAGRLARSRTDGQGADKAVIAVGVLAGDHLAEALSTVRKGGTVVITSVAPMTDLGAPISLFQVAMLHQRIQGSIYGGCNPRRDIPRQVQMYRDGQLILDELVTKTYSLDDIGQGFADLRSGLNLRGVVTFN